jgi:hypothetical protein
LPRAQSPFRPVPPGNGFPPPGPGSPPAAASSPPPASGSGPSGPNPPAPNGGSLT